MAKLISKLKTNQESSKMMGLKPSGRKSLAPEKKEKIVVNLPVKIFLIGFMGSGKTHWGTIWAKKNGLRFYDLDAGIEKATGMSVTDIFEKKGEEKFREMESYHLRKFKRKQNFVLACGGGTPCFSDNIEWMKLQGKVIYLKAEPEILLKHVMSETEKRPVIKKVDPSELLRFIQDKLKERETVYSKADFILNVEELNDTSLSFLISEKK
jgi:shikimate kinase